MNRLKTPQVSSFSLFVDDFKQLTKVRLAVSVVFSSISGYFLAADSPVLIDVILLAFGGYFMVGASNAFNQILEKDLDALMDRTKNRPLPSGRMSVRSAFLVACILTVLGLLVLYTINTRTAFFGGISVFLYVFLYTPLKTKTPLAVFVGAFPGAIPFMLGWVAYSNHFGIEPGVLFMIQFFWQFPHFWSIGWMLDEDYKRAGFKMLPTGKADNATAFQIIFYTLWMIVVSVLPATSYTGSFDLSISAAIIVVFLGLIMLFFALELMVQKTTLAAKKLMFSSVGYITLIQIIYVIDKIIK
ncbi:MAG: protoheme IX farnesyltransferase [Flavobacteriales bacterium]|nr:protoheme IX farnesyltransferase [Candidatus Arcticimaribacter sp.]